LKYPEMRRRLDGPLAGALALRMDEARQGHAKGLVK
jgi:hypothetical protein